MSTDEQEYDPHRTVSAALTEVRTVLSRAMSAATTLEDDVPGFDSTMHDGKPRYAEYAPHPHPDLPEMRAAIRKVIELLEPWERYHGKRGARCGAGIPMGPGIRGMWVCALPAGHEGEHLRDRDSEERADV